MTDDERATLSDIANEICEKRHGRACVVILLDEASESFGVGISVDQPHAMVQDALCAAIYANFKDHAGEADYYIPRKPS